ncbi:pyrroline-5-carboxylate reductase [Nanchangia anserum]|uniref:Pyrroline-5-carboxylate reductase n=1 Tax=Nanchangia anserum TaxID=2692125 RepID=A0A8I0GBA9_9ACTO|nr:pyrroline-5-carboxylate reductase [Nanchangia anserum]MBD3689020.1 pyrroline-5-carboxylate reductase [Nanchangia anserum]QOX81265.1 pyrroline-5-carboxylate reductase [Nanchangia anserum]
MRVGIIGCGNMGGAIAAGIREGGLVEAGDLSLFDASTEVASRLADEIGAHPAESLEDFARDLGEGDVVVLAVKPHLIAKVARDYAGAAGDARDGMSVVSVAAGFARERLAEALGGKGVAVRVMPNVAARVGQAMTAIAFPDDATEDQRSSVSAVFEAIGEVLVLDEDLFSAYSALGGCSPAWLAAIADAFAQAGVAQGLTKAQAMAAITQAMRGTADLLASLGDGPAPAATLVDQVCSPGGTTVAGLLALEDRGMREAAHAAVAAAAERDRALGAD